MNYLVPYVHSLTCFYKLALFRLLTRKSMCVRYPKRNADLLVQITTQYLCSTQNLRYLKGLYLNICLTTFALKTNYLPSGRGTGTGTGPGSWMTATTNVLPGGHIIHSTNKPASCVLFLFKYLRGSSTIRSLQKNWNH